MKLVLGQFVTNNVGNIATASNFNFKTKFDAQLSSLGKSPGKNVFRKVIFSQPEVVVPLMKTVKITAS